MLILDKGYFETRNKFIKPLSDYAVPYRHLRNANINIVLVLIAVGIIVVVALCVMLFGSKGEEAIPMEDIKGSDMVTVDDFEMVW